MFRHKYAHIHNIIVCSDNNIFSNEVLGTTMSLFEYALFAPYYDDNGRLTICSTT